MIRRLAAGPVFSARYRRPVLCWAVTRALLLLFAFNVLPYFSRGAVTGDVALYRSWAHTMVHRHSFPVHDPQWQYPPGAALVMLAPLLITWTGTSYLGSFILVAFAADAVIFTLLVGQTERIARESQVEPHRTGLWAWLLGGVALGPILYMRYDVIVTAAALCGVVAAARAVERRQQGRERAERLNWDLSGGMIGLGAIVKAWPAVLLLGLPHGRRGWRALAAAAVTALAVALALMAALPGGLSFLSGQSDRGIEVESVLASPFVILSWFGLDIHTVHLFGNFQLSGPGTGVVASLAIVLTVIGFGIVLWWRLRRFNTARWTPALMHDIGFTVVLVMIVTSRVLSPQYLIWLTGLAALCLSESGPSRRGTLMAKPAWLVLACVAISQFEFPVLFGETQHQAVFGTLVVAARNAVLVAAAVIALRTLWNAATGPDEAADLPGARIQPEPAVPSPVVNNTAVGNTAVNTAPNTAQNPAAALPETTDASPLSQTGGRS